MVRCQVLFVCLHLRQLRKFCLLHPGKAFLVLQKLILILADDFLGLQDGLFRLLLDFACTPCCFVCNRMRYTVVHEDLNGELASL